MSLSSCIVGFSLDIHFSACTARSPGRQCSIALDTKGPEIRTGMLASESITVEQGQTIRLTTDESKRESGTSEELFLDYMFAN